MNYKTSDDWFWAGGADDSEMYVRLGRVAEVIWIEAREAARKADTEGAWPAARDLGYDRDTIAWRMFLDEYLTERKAIESTPHGWRFV